MSNRVDVAEVIGSRHFGAFQLKIVVLCGMIQFLDGFDTQALAYAAPALHAAWHFPTQALGSVFALGALGTGIGSVLVGPRADSIGRRKVMIGCVSLFGALTLFTAFLTSIDELRVWRVVTGLGLGAALPLTFVIANEFAPSRMRARMIAVMACGFAIGAISGGLLEAALIPLLGWQGVFYFGGVVPLLLAAALYVYLPESVRFLATRPGTAQRIAKILKQIDPETDYTADMVFNVASEPTRVDFAPVQLFSDGRAAMTGFLWIVYLVTLGQLNTLNNWLPLAINMAGLPVQRSVLITTLFQFGGIVGVLSLGAMADRTSYFRVLVSAYTVLALCIAAIGEAGNSALMLSVAVAAMFLVGANNTLNAFTSTLYPTVIRSTGASWGSSFGRLTSSAAPYFAGLLPGIVPLRTSFLIFAVPSLVGAAAFLGMMRTRGPHDLAPSIVPA